MPASWVRMRNISSTSKHTTAEAVLQGGAPKEVLHPPVETRGHSDFNFGNRLFIKGEGYLQQSHHQQLERQPSSLCPDDPALPEPGSTESLFRRDLQPSLQS